MKILVIIVVVLALVVAGGFFFVKHRHFNTTDRGDLERSAIHEIDKLFRQPESRAMVVGIYKDGHSRLWTLGVPHAGSTEPVGPETEFQIGSITKVFTVALLKVLSEEGVVSMDSTLSELIGADVKLSPAAKKITLTQLASHTSGLPRVPEVLIQRVNDIVGDGDVMLDPYSHLNPGDMFDYLAATPDLKAPGKYNYSNFGMGLLAHVLVKVTGNSYENLLTEKILNPLGMHDTTVSGSHEMGPRMSQGYTDKGQETPPWSFNVLAGAGALNSTGTDMMKFLIANLENNSALFDTLESIRQVNAGSNIRLGWIGADFLQRILGVNSHVWHNGMTGGYASYIAIDEHSHSGVFILSNEAVPSDMLGMMLVHRTRYQSWSVD